MCIREKKNQPKGLYRDKEVAILEENEHEYFIYLKDFVCGYVPKDKVTMNTEDKKWFFVENNNESNIIFEDIKNISLSGGGFRSCGYLSKEELIKEMGVPGEPCKVCNKVFHINYIKETRKILLEKGVCLSCYYWQGRLEKKDLPESIIMNGSAYWDAGFKVNGGRGFGGSLWKIKKFTGEVIQTNDLWHNGTIPPHFKDQLPDNAEKIS
jgi:hypothetical protein